MRPWVVSWLVGRTQATTPERETVESDKQVQGYTTRQDSARSLRRDHTHGRRECKDQVGTQKLGEHQSTAPRVSSGRDHQRTKDNKVLGLLGRPHGYPDEHRREKPRMNNAPRNLHSTTLVSANTSTGRSQYAPACTSTGEMLETSPRETRKE